MKIRSLTLARVSFLVVVTLLLAASLPGFSHAQEARAFRLAVHGGAGTILKENMSPELEKAG